MSIRSPVIYRIGALAAAVFMLASCTVVVDEPVRPLPPRPGPPACTREFNPVCARRGGDTQTFSNACIARAEGYRIIHRGECRRAEPPRMCTREYRPVCARRGPDIRTFGNACEAESANFRVLYPGRC
jgi:hypothetical protein